MQSAAPSGFRKVFSQLSEFAAFLLTGTVLALLWANINHDSYEAFVEGTLFYSNILSTQPDHSVNFHFLVNDIFMMLFFGIAIKEVAEAFLPGGQLSSVSKATMPIVATAGGVLGPIGIFFLLHFLLKPEPTIYGAWAVPTATDIAYCWLFARVIFGKGHPAVPFLLVLAVLDDMVGMGIIAGFYTNPQDVHFEWLGLIAIAIGYCIVLRKLNVTNFWPYLLVGGPLAWIGLHYTGVHAALALVPIVPFMPHAIRDAGMFVDDPSLHDTMNQFEHFFKPIVDVGLFTFGLANAGVILSTEAITGSPTWIIFGALLIGKTGGIFITCALGKTLGLKLPEGMTMKQVVVLGCVAAIGFTVALFVTTVAVGLDDNIAKSADMLKLGALLSFGSGFIALALGKAVGIKRID